VSLKLRKLFPLTIAVIPAISQALPIDWHGTFGVDSTMITDYRRIDSKVDNSASDNGTQEVGLAAGKKASASFQSYIFKLSPEIIINDSATMKAELTTGYASGGFLGDAPSNNKANTSNVETYYNNQAGTTNVTIKKAYLELSSDTARYEIGRHTHGWGLGALYSDGNAEWNRFAYSRDGVTAYFKFNNFMVTPFWTQSSNTGLTRSTDSKEIGSSFLYDNKEKDIAFGLYYAIKSNNGLNTYYKSSTATLGSTDVKVTDIYFKKIFGKFNFAVEVPMLSGDLGHVVNSTTNTSYNAKAVLFQSNYEHSDAWTFGLDAGDVSGHDGTNAKFGAMYLNPNYQIANILFKYNLNAFKDGSTESVFDSYITNTQYIKLRATYGSEKWILDFAFITAKAKEVAKAGTQAYNHTKNKLFTANAAQNDSLGSELDFNAKYKWNKDISVNTGLGYLMTGDYYAFTNSGTPNKAKNSLLLHINTILNF